MPHDYPSGIYQPGSPSPGPKIHLIQTFLNISDSPFASSELLNLEPLLDLSCTLMNITNLDDPIYYIPYIYQVPSTSLISGQISIDSRRNIYVVSIDNENLHVPLLISNCPGTNKIALYPPL